MSAGDPEAVVIGGNITAAWSRTAPAWRPAMNQFAILYGDRFLTPQP